MKIEKIFIRNFRSIGEDGLEIIFTNNHTIFVGENNVGKSSIIEAIKKALDFDAVKWESEEWYLGDRSKSIEIDITFVLDDEIIKKIISSIFGNSISIEEFKEDFPKKLNYKFEKNQSESSLTFKFNDFTIDGSTSTGWFGEINNTSGYTQIFWPDEIINKIKERITIKKIKDVFEKCRKEKGPNLRINFPASLGKLLRDLICDQIIFIEEFREKPQTTLGEFLSSPTGKDLASALFNLKNSRQKAKFEQIQKLFNKLFPNLKLDVIKESNEIKILIQKDNVESTTFFIGSGILETIEILTHIIAHKDKVICIDHPELHLHPHTQRLLSNFIRTMEDSQILVVTHSPYFVNLDKNTDVIRVFQDHTQTKIVQLPKGYFQDNEYNKLSQFLDVDSKELFFARKGILVEGPTELGALPVFSSEIYNFDENGITIIDVGGKNNFEIFAKLCAGFKLPCLIVADKDAEFIIEKICKNYPTIKSYILPKEFDDILPPQIVEEAKKVVGGKKINPRIGRYVAKRLLELGEPPKEIKEIIESVKSL
jgi:predicted ATP-dependent endonuclease of OLD family